MPDDDQPDQLRHIRVPDSAEPLSYTPVTGGGGSSELPDRDRESHANELLQQIDAALAQGRQIECDTTRRVEIGNVIESPRAGMLLLQQTAHLVGRLGESALRE